MIKPLTKKEKERIHKGCKRDYVSCHESYCPFLGGYCKILEGKWATRPYQDSWTGNHLFKDEDNTLYIKTDRNIKARFPTEKQNRDMAKQRAKNFLESW